jgi:hypothetical protein
MRRFNMLIALAATSIIGSAALAKEKADQPRERKVCRTVQMSGRITPQRICRKVERRSTEEQSRRDEAKPDVQVNEAD